MYNSSKPAAKKKKRRRRRKCMTIKTPNSLSLWQLHVNLLLCFSSGCSTSSFFIVFIIIRPLPCYYHVITMLLPLSKCIYTLIQYLFGNRVVFVVFFYVRDVCIEKKKALASTEDVVGLVCKYVIIIIIHQQHTWVFCVIKVTLLFFFFTFSFAISPCTNKK